MNVLNSITHASFVGSNKIDKSNFLKEHVMVLVSVGQKKHYNHYMEATVDLINKCEFSECSILVCDTLQRHNYMMFDEMGEKEAYQTSLEKGQEWIIKNKRSYSSLKMKTNIIRWDYWLKHSQYTEKKRKIDSLLENDDNFKSAVLATVDEFFERNRKKIFVDLAECKNFSISYLLEECAAMLIWPLYNYNYEVYPGVRNSAMNYIYLNNICSSAQSILRPLTLRFKKKRIKSESL